MTPAATPEALVEALARHYREDHAYLRSTADEMARALVAGPLAPFLASLQRVTAERDEARSLHDEAAEAREMVALLNAGAIAEAALATATAEAASLRAEVEARGRTLKDERARRKAAIQSVREKAAALCDEAAAYFDRTTGHYDRTQAAGGYRATASKIRLLTPDRTALAARAATAREGRSDA